MKKIISLILILSSLSLFSQQEAANWYFGYGAGMHFDQATGNINVVDDGQLSTNEGCSSISDSDGNLLFYSDGTTVWNKFHGIMQNGNGLYGDSSSTQSALIVPKPDDINIYYVFTVDNNLDGNNFGLNYSEIDMTLDGGLGAVTNKNINLLPICSEKISAVLKDCVNKSIWVITFASQSGGLEPYNSFHAFEVSNTGINTTAIVSPFGVNITDERGYLKLSPDGTKLANANTSDGLFLYDFDVNTGEVSNQQELIINSQSDKPYGVEFSQSNQFLYVHSSNDYFSQNFNENNNPVNHNSTLTQFDLTVPNIQASEFTIDQRQLYRGGLQLAPDGKIYRALSSTYNQGLSFLGVINNPNDLGPASNYQHNAVNLSPNNSSQGLPPFIQSLFNLQIDIIQSGVSTINLDLCDGDTYTLVSEDILNATYTWTLDNNPLPETDFDLDINQEGHYQVFIDPNNGDCAIEGQAYVSYYENPIANQPSDLLICDDNNDGISSFNFINQDADVLGTQDNIQFSVHYYESLIDAQNDDNEIVGTYENSSNPQEIFVRVKNVDLNRCAENNSFSSFHVEVFNSPTANTIQDVEICDDNVDGDYANGQVITYLLQFNNTILSGQNDPNYSITYHSSLVDAENGANPLSANYYNSNAFTETVYVRIQNDLNSLCFDTTEFVINIFPRPDALNASLFQCDEDGLPDGFTLFNLTEANTDLTGGIANLSTKFFLSLTDAENSVNEIDGNAFNNFSNPQTIYVQVIDDTSGCFNISELTLEVSATNANDASLEICDDDGTEDGFNTFNLSDAEADILIGLPNNLDVQFFESYEDALLEVNPLNTNYTNSDAYSQIIYVRVENENACYGINEIQLTVFELPNIETEFQTIYCLNTFPETITLTSGIINDSPSNYIFSWDTGENSSEIEINQPNTYNVIVSNVNGCSKSRIITVLPSNIASIDNIEVTDASQNNTITILISGEGDYEFALDNINGPYFDDNFFENVSAGIHTVFVRDKNACGIAEELVSVIGFPRFFTPNNDGYNDTWQVKGVNAQFQPNTLIYIYDRYGKLISQIDPAGLGWNGILNGKPLPNDDYWFAITLEDGRIFKDHFTLKR